MNYTTHAENITTRLVDMIQTGSHGQWAMPWHTHDPVSYTHLTLPTICSV